VYKRQKNYAAAMKLFMELSSQNSVHGGQNMEQLQAKFRNDQSMLATLRASDGYTTAHAATEGEISVTTARIAALRSLSELWFQIGHTHELQNHYKEAKEAYTTVLTYDPTHAKVLQKLGWLYYHAPSIITGASVNTADSQKQPRPQRSGASVTATTQQDQTATAYLERSVASDPSDHQAWYLLGKCCTRQKQYQKAFRAYEQAVLLNDREPVYWCSLGILYYHNSQYHEALDTYARALQLAPELSETW
jgi:cytochrome c-type biogenesis protein CcmH/NrfG